MGCTVRGSQYAVPKRIPFRESFRDEFSSAFHLHRRFTQPMGCGERDVSVGCGCGGPLQLQPGYIPSGPYGNMDNPGEADSRLVERRFTGNPYMVSIRAFRGCGPPDE